jgi:hypothetical protein
MKGHFRSLSRINTVPVPAEMEPSFISEKFKFCVRNVIIYCPLKPVTKMTSSLIIAFFRYLNV